MRDEARIAGAAAEHGATPVRALAVVIPVFRHSVLLAEAVESVLAQEGPFGLQIVLVNDGCPHVETDAVCRAYAEAWPERIRYLRKPNGGLSDARNHGIRHVLAETPEVDAIYMMDADNRLRPGALARAAAELDAHPEADWIYPNIDMFGLSWAGDYGGDYSLLLHSRMNLCEAGSLIRRRVFASGVFFDTEFKQGFEDWEFFLQAAGRGFRGRNIENFGFLYRKRGESMLAESEREAAVLRGEIERKHRKLYQPRQLVDLEQAEAPRYAVVLSDRDQVLVMLDPARGPQARMTREAFEALWWRGQTGNSRYHVPPCLVVTRSAVLDTLQAAGLLHFAFWILERRTAPYCFAGLALERGTGDRLGWREEPVEGRGRLRADMVMARPALLRDLFRDPSDTWVSGLAAAVCSVPAGVVTLTLPPSQMPARAGGFLDRLRQHLPDVIGLQPWSAAQDMVQLARRMQRSAYRAAADAVWEWREAGIDWRRRSAEVARLATGAQAAFPRASDGRYHVGFLLPLVEFGGVERVALNMATALRAAGLVPHLFVLQAQEIQFSPEWRKVFETVTFLADPAFVQWWESGMVYSGTAISGWSRWGDHGDALAMLGWLDLVLNFQGGPIAGLMGKLRRYGVKTGLSLHLSDLSVFARPVGNTYLGLAYEHAYDFFLPCSQQLAHWCHGMGVPEEKIVPVPNAPGFALPEGIARMPREPGAALRAIYLGRLDAQKGIDRLIATIRMAKAAGVSVRWRLMGKAVIDGGMDLPEDIAALVEPPVHEAARLAAALAEADVFFLPSYFEGLPLTVLEAMRSGVVPLAADVGAVSEVVRDGENGILLRGEDMSVQAIEALRRLAADRAYLERLSAQAQADMVGRDWTLAVRPLLAHLQAARPEDKGSADGAPGETQ